MIYKRSINPFCFTFALLLFRVFLSSGASLEQQLLAVFDLTSDSSISAKNLKAISDNISVLVERDSSYSQFSREMLPELFNQLAIDHSALICSDPQCLILLGNLIGANAAIGGFIKRSRERTMIELSLVNVSKKQIINTVSLTTAASIVEFKEEELPELVKSLLGSRTNTSPLRSKSLKKKSAFTNPMLYVGTVVVGGAAAAAYYFLVYTKDDNHQSVGQPSSEPLSLDDIPIPARGE